MENLEIIVNNAVSASVARSVAEAYWRVHEENIKKRACEELPHIYENIMLASLSGKFSIEYPLPVIKTYTENHDKNLYLGTIVETLHKEEYKLAYSGNNLVVRW